MGYSSWSDDAYKRVSEKRAGASSREIFRGERSCDPLMSPHGLKARESRDSEHHPESVPIIVAFDVTGSMGDIPTRFAQEWLGKLMTRLVEGGWVKDPQVLIAAVGDAEADRAPLQVGQFESGLEMDMWLTRLWLEGGGGDAPESYLLPHWFAAHHTSTDAWEKRKAKGYLFSIGDAENKPLTAAHVERVFGYRPEGQVSDQRVISDAAERWHLFHILVSRNVPPRASLLKHWQDRIGPGVLTLQRLDAICELLGAVMGLREGRLDQARARAVLEAAHLDADDRKRALAVV
jgi:hypothetical protein